MGPNKVLDPKTLLGEPLLFNGRHPLLTLSKADAWSWSLHHPDQSVVCVSLFPRESVCSQTVFHGWEEGDSLSLPWYAYPNTLHQQIP